MKVTVIGQGYVGATLAVGAAEAGFEVIGFDIDKNIVSNLRNGLSITPDVSKQNINELLKSGKYYPTYNPQEINNSKIIVIAVPTPLNSNREPDLKYLEQASILIAENVTKPALVINESTSYPGTLRNFIKPAIESRSDVNFEYASAPERIDPGNKNWKLSNTPRNVGGLTQGALEKATKFYKAFCQEVTQVKSPEVAEAAKLFENTFRQINIALANEFSIISSALGYSANEAIQAASSKPFGFMPFFPSIGVGGHCIPVDPTYLNHAALKAGVRADFIELANKTNLSMAKFIVEKIRNYLKGSISGIKIQIAGIAYKPNVADLRESPALDLIRELRSVGAEVSWHDPLVVEYNHEKSEPLNSSIDLGLIITPHSEINFSVWKDAGTNVLDLSPNSINFGWSKFL